MTGRSLDLRDINGNLLSDAFARILAVQFFPEDEDARRQVALICEDERARFLRLGESWRPSALSETVLTSTARRRGQLIICGYVTLALVLLLEHERSATVYAASKVVEKALAEMPGAKAKRLSVAEFRGDWELVEQQMPTARKAIERAFTDHSAIAHVLAGDIAASEHLYLMHIFNRTPESIAAALSTAAAIEVVLTGRLPGLLSNPWRVAHCLPNESALVEPIYPEGETRAFLMKGMETTD